MNIGAFHIPGGKVGAVAAGAIGLAAGAAIAGGTTRACYLHDLFADKYQVLDDKDGYVVVTPRAKIGPLAMGGSIVLGAAIAGASAFVHGEGAMSMAGRQLLRLGGMGVVAGGVGASWLYRDGQLRKD